MSKEVYGDRSLTIDLISYVNQVQQSTSNKHEKITQATNSINSTLMNETIGPLSDK